MTTIKTAIAAAALAFALSAGTAMAQTAAPAPTTPPAAKVTKAPKAKTDFKPKSEASAECSKEADAKSLHGKERKKFREACLKTAKKNAPATTTTPAAKVEPKKS
jgi:psiF repeat